MDENMRFKILAIVFAVGCLSAGFFRDMMVKQKSGGIHQGKAVLQKDAVMPTQRLPLSPAHPEPAPRVFSPQEIETLVKNLFSDKAPVRSQAAFDLQQTGPAGKPAVPRLVELLKDPDDSVRWRSVAAIGHIGYFTDEIKQAVYQAFNDPNEKVRYNTIFAISMMKDRGREASELFLKALDDPSSMVIGGGIEPSLRDHERQGRG